MTTPIRIAVTGAGVQIAYALLFLLASGAAFGSQQPVALQLLEITPALPALGGTLMGRPVSSRYCPARSPTTSRKRLSSELTGWYWSAACQVKTANRGPT